MGDSLPWERRQQLGFANALVETAKLFITAPAEAWSRTQPKGDLFEPLLFAVIVSWVGMVFSSVYGMFMTVPWIRMLPPEAREKFGGLLVPHAGGVVVQIIFGPVFIAIGLFIWAGILHVSLMVVGGLEQSPGRFEGTFRAVAYSSVAQLAHVVPFVGGFAAAIWGLVLVVMGVTALHRTTQGKAIAAVLIPVAVCCVCAVLSVVVFVGALAGLMHR